MLVLTRRDSESLQIGEIRITVVRSKDGEVKLGIEAPPSVTVQRTELLEPEAPQT